MTIRLTFKTPDVTDQIQELQEIDQLDEDDYDEYGYGEKQAILQTVRKFVRDEECITIEIDTDKHTATVIPVKDN